LLAHHSQKVHLKYTQENSARKSTDSSQPRTIYQNRRLTPMAASCHYFSLVTSRIAPHFPEVRVSLPAGNNRQIDPVASWAGADQ
jgi:hypothetical protein